MATSNAFGGSTPEKNNQAVGHEEAPLLTEGFKGTPEEIEQQWYEQCYRGRGDSMLQLTLRAVIMGSLLGGILSLTNLYIGLKAGWGFGVAITACIVSYALWTTFHKLGLVRTQMTILENNCMQSTASAAGYSTGGTLISAFSAYMMLGYAPVPVLQLMGLVFFLAVLGVTMAIPMKRQMVNVEQLRFPSGIAAAETLKALHSTGGKGMRSARALGLAGLLGALDKFAAEGFALLIPKLAGFSLTDASNKVSTMILGPVWPVRTVSFTWDAIFVAAGAITGLRVCASMLLGGTLCWVIFLPALLDRGVLPLTVRESIPSMPPNVVFPSGKGPWFDVVEYNRFSKAIQFRGVMTESQRDHLLSLSPDIFYQAAIRRLYVRSQFRAAEPLAALPPGVVLEPETGVTFNSTRGLEAPELLSADQYAKLRAKSTDATFISALDRIYARSALESFQPLWVSASLAALPAGAAVPPEIGGRFAYDAGKKLAFWQGPLTPADQETLLSVSADTTYRDAIASLAAAAAEPTLSAALPVEAAEYVRFDATRRALVATGTIPEAVQKKLAESEKENIAYQRSVSGLVKQSAAKRAAENYRDLVGWSLWGGTACMVTSGLLSFALQWRTALRAFSGVGAMFLRRRTAESAVDKLEAPIAWFFIGQVVATIGLAILGRICFGIEYWETAIAVVLSFGLALVACRVTGETDTTPVGAMGKISQLSFAAISPGNNVVNLMSANVTAAAATSSADLLTDLKSGYLLGANPRRQFIAQFCGIFAGTAASVLGFSLIITNPADLGSSQFPAPAAQVWKAVAEALNDITTLHPVKIWCIIIGGIVGLVLPIASLAFPKYAKFIPSAAGIGLAWTFHWFTAWQFFLGAVIGWLWEKGNKKHSDEYMFPIASGVIAGGSLMGVLLIFIENGPEMWHKLFG